MTSREFQAQYMGSWQVTAVFSIEQIQTLLRHKVISVAQASGLLKLSYEEDKHISRFNLYDIDYTRGQIYGLLDTANRLIEGEE